MSAYDKIARVYDPWSVSVVEDVPFYLDEAERSGGPVLELGVGTGRIAVPIAAAGIEVVGVDLSAGMLEVARERAALAGVELDLRHGDMRDPPVEGEFPLVPPRSARCCTWRPTPTGARSCARCSAARAGRPFHLRRLHAGRGGHRGDARPVARARARASGSAPTGTRRRGR